MVGADGKADTVIMKDKWGVNYMWSEIPRNRDWNDDNKTQ